MTTDPRTRFEPHAQAYAIGRPGYPRALGELVASLGNAVADVGAGTGLATEMLLACGLDVIAIEPSPAMRAQARVPVREGSAEATGLPDSSVDVVFAAQAAHWFDPDPTRAEWTRILRPGGHVVLAWNGRRLDDAFAAELDATLRRFGEGRNSLEHTAEHRGALVERLLGAHTHVAFPNTHELDAATFDAYIRSISYVRDPDTDAFAAVFARHARDGRVTLPLVTDAYYATW